MILDGLQVIKLNNCNIVLLLKVNFNCLRYKFYFVYLLLFFLVLYYLGLYFVINCKEEYSVICFVNNCILNIWIMIIYYNISVNILNECVFVKKMYD